MLGKWQLVAEGVDLLLLQPVDFINMGLHDSLQAMIIKTVQAKIGNSRKAAPDFVCASSAGIEALNFVCDGPLNRLIIAGVKVQRIYLPRATPVTAV